MNKISFIDHVVDNFQNCRVQSFWIVGSVEIKTVELGEAVSHVRSFLDAVEKAGPRIALKYIVLFSVAFIIWDFM